jgi:serine phosphatase RsbU (regulator of sigma subunit)
MQGDAPDVILTKLGELLSIKDDGHFATVLCGRLDPRAGRLETANAGHLDPLLIANGSATFLKTRAGVPIGAMTAPNYRLITTELPATGTLLLYTDGLIERRGESLDIGFSRLARAAEQEADAPVEAMLAGVVNDLIPAGANDDTALLGLRWAP